MGLETTHDCFAGSYGSFHLLRSTLADAANLPPLDLMQGYLTKETCEDVEQFGRLVDEARRRGYPVHSVPIGWDELPHDILHVLLRASDSEGGIPHAVCLPLSERLMQLAQLNAERSADQEDDVTNNRGENAGGESDDANTTEEQFPSVSSAAWQRAMTTFVIARFAAGLRAAHLAGEDVRFF